MYYLTSCIFMSLILIIFEDISRMLRRVINDRVYKLLERGGSLREQKLILASRLLSAAQRAESGIERRLIQKLGIECRNEA